MMKSVKEVLSENDPSPWTGSEATFELVKSQVESRFGKKVADQWRPEYDTRTFRAWLARNYAVMKNQRGLESFVIIERKNDRGEIEKKRKKIWLFHKNQVSPIK
jgi:hypothetical protein